MGWLVLSRSNTSSFSITTNKNYKLIALTDIADMYAKDSVLEPHVDITNPLLLYVDTNLGQFFESSFQSISVSSITSKLAILQQEKQDILSEVFLKEKQRNFAPLFRWLFG